MDVPANHGMFIYDRDEEFVDRVQSYLGPGTEDGELGMAVVSRGKWALLREALGESAAGILYLDREALYSRPHEALAGYDEVLRRALAEGAPAMRLIGELPCAHGQVTCAEWTLYEAAINRAFEGRPIWILCGYDAREQSPEALEGAWQTHPGVLLEGWEDNPRYQDPAHLASALTPQPEELSGLRELPLHTEAEAFSAALRRELELMRVPSPRAEKLLRAAAELFENAATHGGGARSQRIGRAGRLVVWELSDNGPGFQDALAGYVPPRPDQLEGRGLWVARQLAHRLEFFTSSDGFTGRVWI